MIDGELIITTPDHPFYTDEGWTDAGDLEPGDLILALDGDYGTVESVVIVAETQTMYDLDVAIVDTFAVGDGAWVVHNQDEIPIDPEFLRQIGVTLDNAEISDSFIRLSRPSSYVQIGTVIGDFGVGAFGQTVQGLGQLSSHHGASSMLVRVPNMVNPDLIRLSLNPRFLDRYQLEIMDAHPN